MVTGRVIDGEIDKVEIGMRLWASFRMLGKEGPGGVIQYGYKFNPEL